MDQDASVKTYRWCPISAVLGHYRHIGNQGFEVIGGIFCWIYYSTTSVTTVLRVAFEPVVALMVTG
jgi:hypothetical protein